MELSLVVRQRAALQRIYSDMDSAVDQTNVQHSRSCSVDWQRNSSFPFPHKQAKRKAELDIEDEIEDEQINQEEVIADENSEITGNNSSKGSMKKDSEAEKQDYIHVRARRGQATDSHSLAERARREKISKKMKSLQDLVPGCNKVTGKAGMLDEIINYVQSLQKQVEFLSMKLSVVNPRLDFNGDNFFAKEIPTYISSLPAQLEAANSACFQHNQMQVGITNFTATNQSLQVLSQKAGTTSLPIPELFLDSSSISQLQQLSNWESDWQNLFPAGIP